MTIIAAVFAAVAVPALALCALADPVLLSRVNGEAAEGDSGRHLRVRPEPVASLAVANSRIRRERLAA